MQSNDLARQGESLPARQEPTPMEMIESKHVDVVDASGCEVHHE